MCWKILAAAVAAAVAAAEAAAEAVGSPSVPSLKVTRSSLLSGFEIGNVGLVTLDTRLTPPFSRQCVVVVDLTELTLDLGVLVHGLGAAAGAIRGVRAVDADGLFVLTLFLFWVAVSTGALLTGDSAFQAEEASRRCCLSRGFGSG